MKRILCLLTAILVLCAGCAGKRTDKPSDTDKTTESTKPQDTVRDTEYPLLTDTSLPTLQKDVPVTLDGVAEVMLDYLEINRDVRPTQPDSYYSHYVAEDGKTYVDLCITYKNLKTTAVTADEVMNGTLIYGDRYAYSGFSIIEEESRSDFTYSSITSIAPLDTGYLHYLFEIPEAVSNSPHALTATLTFSGHSYNITVKEGTTATGTVPTPTKQSGEIAAGESVTTENGCFSVSYAKVAAKVVPPAADGYYSYYEADSGKQYMDLCVPYQNLLPQPVTADKVFSAKLIYDGKYEYTGFSIIEEDSRSDFTYSSITSIAPLDTGYLHCLFHLPQEVATSGKSMVFELTVDGNTYTYTLQ